MVLKDDWIDGEVYDAVDQNDVATTINNAGYGLINVRDYGAVGDGSTDDSAAFLAAYTAVVAGSVSTFSYSGGNRVTHSLYIPAGTYLITGNGKLLADLAIPATAGLKVYGDGREATEIVFQPAAANGYLCSNQNDLLHLTFEDMTIYGAGSNAATATFLKSDSGGQAQNYVFNRVNWGGAWKYGFDLTGSNNNSEMSWFHCGIYDDWTAFLHSGTTDASDQFLNYNFFACQVEYSSGDFVDLALGGNINVWGGSLIHAGNGDQTTSDPQRFFRLGAGVTFGTHNGGAQRLLVAGARVEHRHNNSQLIYSEWTRGTITFLSCDTETWHFELTDPTAVVQAEFYTGNSLPAVVFDACSVMGVHKYYFGSSSHEFGSAITYRNCQVTTFNTAEDFVTMVDNSSGGMIGGKPLIRFTDCRIVDNDISEMLDCCLNWQERVNGAAEPRSVSLKQPWGYMPENSAPTVGVKLPINAVITRVKSFKGAGGASTSTNFTYTLTDASATTIAVAQGNGSTAWNAGYTYDSGPLYHVCSTANKRTLTLTAANIPNAAADGMFIIEYLA